MTSKYPVGSQDMFLGLVGQFREIKIKINKNPKKVCPEHGGPLSALRAGWTSRVAGEKKKKKKKSPKIFSSRDRSSSL